MFNDESKKDCEPQEKDHCCCPHDHHNASEEEVGDIVEEQDQLTTISAKELERLKMDAHEYKERYLRSLADMENNRKRLQKEKQDIGKFAIENLVLELLAPIDQFEQALGATEHMTPEVKNWAFGFNMILTQIKDALSSHNISSFDAIGVPFNPHLHEAIETIESDEHEPGTIVKQYYKGYKMGDRLIRPAKVQVAKQANSADSEMNSGETDSKES